MTYYERNKEKIKARALAYYRQNREKVREQQAVRRRTGQTGRADNLRSKFGMSIADYDRLLAEQGGVCAVCRSKDTGRKDRVNFAVDHCHRTGKVRGLLCKGCNTAAGNLNDSPDLCLRLAEYLRKNGVP